VGHSICFSKIKFHKQNDGIIALDLTAKAIKKENAQSTDEDTFAARLPSEKNH